MRKVIFSFAILSLVFVTSCRDDDDNEDRSCDMIKAEFTAARATLVMDQTEDNCLSVISLGTEFLEEECGTEDERAEAAIFVGALDCSSF